MLSKGYKVSKFLTRVCYHVIFRESLMTRGGNPDVGVLVHGSRALRRWPIQRSRALPTGGPVRTKHHPF